MGLASPSSVPGERIGVADREPGFTTGSRGDTSTESMQSVVDATKATASAVSRGDCDVGAPAWRASRSSHRLAADVAAVFARR